MKNMFLSPSLMTRPFEHQAEKLGGIYEHEQCYRIACIEYEDKEKRDEYQRLRADIFVRQLGWSIPIDEYGRERDHYDNSCDHSILTFGVYGMHSMEQEDLLGGIRIFVLQDLQESMVAQEFRTVGMIPEQVLQHLEAKYDSKKLLELTRFCVQRGRWYPSLDTCMLPLFDLGIVRDLVYSSMFVLSEKLERPYALGIASSRYLQIMKRSRFAYELLYASQLNTREGYGLVVIDLWKTIQQMRESGLDKRADRMLALCERKS